MTYYEAIGKSFDAGDPGPPVIVESEGGAVISNTIESADNSYYAGIADQIEPGEAAAPVVVVEADDDDNNEADEPSRRRDTDVSMLYS